MVDQDEWENLKNSYIRYFQFSKSLEKGIHAFNQAVDYLTNEELEQIRVLLGCIADQFDETLTEAEKIASMNSLITTIESLRDSQHNDKIKDIFENLSEIPPNEAEEYRRPRTI